MEEGRAELVLSAPRPTIDLAELRTYASSRLGEKARVSTLHDMLVLDVDRERLVEVATFVRDDRAFVAISTRSTRASTPARSSAR